MRISDWSSDVCSSDLFHHGRRRRPPRDRVADRQRERRGLDLEHIALARLDPLAERQGRGAEEMDMHVAGAAEQAIFEMMVLEVGDAVRHIRFARQKGLFPQRPAIAYDAADPHDMRSEERRGGKECVSKCRSRGTPYNEKKKT